MSAFFAFSFLFVAVQLFSVTTLSEGTTDSDRGFSADFDWVPWAEAPALAQQLNKPIFLLVHQPWCPVCKGLKQTLSGQAGLSRNQQRQRQQLIELSRQFVMVNTEQEQGGGLENDALFGVYGRYVPRIFILTPNGQPLPIERRTAPYPNFFNSLPDLLAVMEQGLNEFRANAPVSAPSYKSPTVKTDEQSGKNENQFTSSTK